MHRFIWAPCAQLYPFAETPQPPPPPPAFELIQYTRALLICQDRRHLFVTPCLQALGSLIYTKRGYWMSSLHFVPGKGIGSSWPTWVSWRMALSLTADSRSLSLARKRSVLKGTVTWDFLAPGRPQFLAFIKITMLLIRSQMSNNDVWLFDFVYFEINATTERGFHTCCSQSKLRIK